MLSENGDQITGGTSGQLRQFFEFSRAVAQFLGRNPQLVQQGQLKIRQRRMFRKDEMTAALDAHAASAIDLIRRQLEEKCRDVEY